MSFGDAAFKDITDEIISYVGLSDRLLNLSLVNKFLSQRVFESLQAIKPEILNDKVVQSLIKNLEKQPLRTKPFFLNLENIQFAEQETFAEIEERGGNPHRTRKTKLLKSDLIGHFKKLLDYIIGSQTAYSLNLLNDDVLIELYKIKGFSESPLVRLVLQNPRGRDLSSYPLRQVKTLSLGYPAGTEEKEECIARIESLGLVDFCPNLEDIYIREVDDFGLEDTYTRKVDDFGKELENSVPEVPKSLLSFSIELADEPDYSFNLAYLSKLSNSQIETIKIKNCFGKISELLPKNLKVLKLVNIYTDQEISFSEGFDWSKYPLLRKIHIIGFSPDQSLTLASNTLEILYLNYCQTGNMDYLNISKCPKLKNLTLGNIQGSQLPASNTLQNVTILTDEAIENFDFSSCPSLKSIELICDGKVNLSKAIFPENLQALIVELEDYKDSEASDLEESAEISEEIAQQVEQICHNFPTKLSCLVINNINYLEGYKSSFPNENQDLEMRKYEKRVEICEKIHFIVLKARQIHPEICQNLFGKATAELEEAKTNLKQAQDNVNTNSQKGKRKAEDLEESYPSHSNPFLENSIANQSSKRREPTLSPP